MFVTPLRSVFLSETKSSAKVRHISDMCKFLEKIIYQQQEKLSKIKMQNPYYQHNKNFAFPKSFPR